MLTAGMHNGVTPLYIATQYGHLPVVQYLMEVSFFVVCLQCETL